jgi:hypothetical protein
VDGKMYRRRFLVTTEDEDEGEGEGKGASATKY